MTPRDRLSLCLLLLTMVPPTTTRAQLGLSCTIAATPVSFGSYNVFASAPLDSSGSLIVVCTQGATVRLQLSPGSAATFAPRTLRNGADVVNYNLYVDAFVSVWGDGSAGTVEVTRSAPALLPTTIPVFGRIPALQSAARVGSYSDTVVATVIF